MGCSRTSKRGVAICARASASVTAPWRWPWPWGAGGTARGARSAQSRGRVARRSPEISPGRGAAAMSVAGLKKQFHKASQVGRRAGGGPGGGVPTGSGTMDSGFPSASLGLGFWSSRRARGRVAVARSVLRAVVPPPLSLGSPGAPWRL
ncbi:hypothetical protein NN561_008989 [Cricetulus griseus]